MQAALQTSRDASKLKRLRNGERLYDRNHPSYLYYVFEGIICSVNQLCTLQRVAVLNRTHPAPGTFSNARPVQDGQHGFASLGYKGAEFDDFGAIIHFVSDDGLSVINYTAPGHRLFPGYVKRTVIQRGQNISIVTTGEGVGQMPRLNENLAKTVWNGFVNGHIRYKVNLAYRVR